MIEFCPICNTELKIVEVTGSEDVLYCSTGNHSDSHFQIVFGSWGSYIVINNDYLKGFAFPFEGDEEELQAQ